MDLSSGVDVFGEGVTQIIDRNNDPYTLLDSDLTDGEPMCAPTAVTMAGFEATANNSPAPFAGAAWPLLAGLTAVVAGGAYALLRRKS